jgi:hypothetical protein
MPRGWRHNFGGSVRNEATWDFETEIENMLAAESSTVKQKKPKITKVGNNAQL